MKTGGFIYLTLILMACAPKSMYGQPSLNDTIKLDPISVSRLKKKTNPIPGTKIETVDSVVMKDKSTLTLAELLGENSTIFIKTYGRGSMATASFRGTSASHTQVFWNGMKINSPMSGQVDFSQIPLVFVDDISIHFGQSSMNFGSGGLGGSVNLKSTPNWQNNGIKVIQSIGSYETFLTGLMSVYGTKRIKGQTRIFRESSENNFSYINKARKGFPIERQTNADYNKMGVLQEVYLRLNTRNMLSFKSWVQENNRGIPKIMSNSPVKEHNRQKDFNTNSILEWNYFGNQIKGFASVGFSSLNFHYNYYKFSVQNDTMAIVNSSSFAKSWQGRVGTEFKINHWLNFSIETRFQNDWVDSYEKKLMSGYKKSIWQNSLLSKLVVSPSKNLKFSVLLNEEMYGSNLSPVMPAFSAEYSLPIETKIKFNGSVGRNVHFPSLNDQYFQPGGNPNLKPEIGLSFEGGVHYAFENLFFATDIGVTFFRSEIENWIMWLPHLKGHWEPININRVGTQGSEFSISALLRRGSLRFKIIGQYTYTLSSVKNSGGIISPIWEGRQLPFIPIHSGGVVLSANWRSFYTTYTFTHFSERYTTTRSNTNSYRMLYPYYMSAVSIGKNIEIRDKTLGMQIRVDNLFNESYQTILWRPMPGRNFNLIFRLEI